MCMGRKSYVVIGVLVLLCVLAYAKVQFDFCGDYEGIYLLKGEGGGWLEVSDDVFPEDVERYLGGFGLTGLKRAVANGWCADPADACLNFEWNEEAGRGFLESRYPQGQKLLICLSRFRNDENVRSHGLFLGGNLPPTNPEGELGNPNETGMTWFDGKRFYHIWCNVNEGIVDQANRLQEPQQWAYTGSRIVKSTPNGLTLTSSHQAVVNGVPVNVERYLFYETGDAFVTLVTTLTNVGKETTRFSYFYGDEPWVGNYGTSGGDVGWVKNGLVLTETALDPKKESYAGIFDYGNELAGEQHVYTKTANFIEWQRQNGPTAVYFSNQFGKVARPEEKVPLAHHTNRVIGLEWGQLQLAPGASFTFRLAVGMAAYDPDLKLPIKPYTGLN